MIFEFVGHRFDKWLKRRVPATKQITLNSRNLFIFPSKSGIHFLISCLILFLLGTNYQNNLILFMVFFLSSFMVTCLLLSYRNLAKLTLTAIDTKAQFAGQDCQFGLRLKYNQNHAQDLCFSFKKGESGLSPIVDGDNVYLYAFSNDRGYFNPGRITLRSSFPFGLYNVWTHLDFDYQLLLYPQPIENRSQYLSFNDDNVAQSLTKSTLGVDQFSTLKSYQVGESLKSVAWKQVAQGKGWMSKQFEQSAGGDQVLEFSRLSHLALETRLSFLCYQIIELEKKGLRYALILPNQKIAAGLGKVHEKRCLTALALFERVSGG